MIPYETAKRLYEYFGSAAAAIIETGQEAMPMVFLVDLHKNDGGFEFVVVDPEIVLAMHNSPGGKDMLMRIINHVLTDGEEIPRVAIHISEAWVIKRNHEYAADEPPPAECADRIETLVVSIHDSGCSRIGMSEIVKSGPHGRHVDLAPLPQDGEAMSFGRMVMTPRPANIN